MQPGAARRPLRVYVVTYTGLSGLTHYAVSLCRELRHHCEVTLVTSIRFDESIDTPFPVKHLFRRSRYYPLDMIRFTRLILTARPDVVLVQSSLKYPIIESFIVRLFRLAGIRTALTVHDVMPHYPKPWSARAHRFFFGSFDKLIVHSVRSAADLAAMGVKREVVTVPHGVYDIFRTRELTREEARETLPALPKDSFVALFFGRVNERKGIEEFLALADAFAGDPTMRFVIAGSSGISVANPSLRRRLASLARGESAGGSSNVLFDDRRVDFEDVQIYLALADVVVLPYREGSTSGVLKLAMAFKKPVLATSVGDIPETVNEARNGIVVSTENNIPQLIEGLRTIHDDFERFKAQCEHVPEKYRWETIARQYADFLVSD